jgi:hypothetical protein
MDAIGTVEECRAAVYMPVKPENKNRYPADWKDIRKDIRKGQQ